MNIADYLLLGLLCSLTILVLVMGFGFLSNSYKLLDFMDTISLGFVMLFKRGAFVWCELTSVAPWTLGDVDGKDKNSTVKGKNDLKNFKPFVFVADDGSLVSLIAIDGMLTIDGPQERNERIFVLTKRLGQYVSTPGYSMQIGMYFDPFNGEKVIAEAQKPFIQAAHRMGLGGLDFFFEDNKENLKKYVADQKYYIALWTTPSIISRENAKAAGEERVKNMLNSISLKRTQSILGGNEYIKSSHISYVNSVISALKSSKDCSIQSRLMYVDEAMQLWRSFTDPKSTTDKWKPKTIVRNPAMHVEGSDLLADIWWPDIRQEIFPDGLTKVGDFIKVPGRIYAFLHVQFWPSVPEVFNQLFTDMENSKIPFAMNMNVISGGFESMSFVDSVKEAVAGIAGFHINNKLYSAALDNLRAMKNNGGFPVGVQLVFSTWIDEDEDIGLLRNRQASIRSTIQSWGECSVSIDIGDPGMAFSSILCGVSRRLSAPITIAPFHEIIPMLPLDQSAQLWKSGAFLFRSKSRLMPMEQGSRLQTAGLDIGVSPMGGGKSLLLNMYDLSFILQSNGTLPYLTKLDIGYSGKSLITALHAALPDDKKHLVLYSRVRMDTEYSINVMDLPLGFDSPTPYHKSFIVSFVTLLVGDKETGKCNEYLPGLIGRCVDRAYIKMKDSPKEFKADKDPEITEALKKIPEYDSSKRYYWMDIRDMFYSNHRGRDNFIAMAIKAQSYAVPILPELAAVSRDTMIASEYDGIGDGRIIDDFGIKMSDAMSSIPILTGHSKFNVGAAKIMVLDLEEAAPSSDSWKVAVMYTLAKFIGTSNFFRREEDISHCEEVYVKYQKAVLESVRESPKRLSMDEVHRIFKNNAVSKNIETDIETFGREGRKNSVHIGLYSQKLADIPNNIIDLTQSRYILGTGTADEKKIIRDKFGLNNTAVDAMGDIGTPTAAGANLLAIFRTAGKDTVVQFLTNTVGRKTLWLLSTHPKEAPLRDKLYARIGVRETIDFLTRRFKDSNDIDILIKDISSSASSIEGDEEGAISLLANNLYKEYMDEKLGAKMGARFKSGEELMDGIRHIMNAKNIRIRLEDSDLAVIAEELFVELTMDDDDA